MPIYPTRIDELALAPGRRMMTHFTEHHSFEAILKHGVLTNREILDRLGYAPSGPGIHVTMAQEAGLPSGSLVSVQDLSAAHKESPEKVARMLHGNGHWPRVFFELPANRHAIYRDNPCWPGFLAIGTKNREPTVPPDKIIAFQLDFPNAGVYPRLANMFSGRTALAVARAISPGRDWNDVSEAETFLSNRAKRLVRRHVGVQAAQDPHWDDYALALAKEYRIAIYNCRGNKLYSPRKARR